ncbi:hypothetical protein [Nocardia flavorosea]|uniref:hypothetical protein n=1 Tax=Nocardia flavorosea TaxID=53429 RepID=UPI000AAEAA43|nr:hypothetical protein [Nocardia flavorosea]
MKRVRGSWNWVVRATDRRPVGKCIELWTSAVVGGEDLFDEDVGMASLAGEFSIMCAQIQEKLTAPRR